MTQIELMRELELFVFHNMSNSMSSANRSDPTLLNAKNENEFRLAVYTLHDTGKLKETEKQKVARTRTYPYTDNEGFTFIDMPTRQCPKYYDEIVTAIRHFRQLDLENTSIEEIEKARLKAFKIYADHNDCFYFHTIPQTIFRHIAAIKKAYETDTIKKLKITIYLECLSSHIELIRDQPKQNYQDFFTFFDKINEDITTKVFDEYEKKIKSDISFYDQEIITINSSLARLAQQKPNNKEPFVSSFSDSNPILAKMCTEYYQKSAKLFEESHPIVDLKKAKKLYTRMRSKKYGILNQNRNILKNTKSKKKPINQLVGDLDRIIHNATGMREKLEVLIIIK